MNQTVPNQSVLEVARQVIGEVAPAEEPLFEPLSQAYLENPNEFVAEQPSTDDMLGFGGLEAVPMLTPIVIGQVSQLFSLAQAAVSQIPPDAVGQFARFSVENVQLPVDTLGKIPEPLRGLLIESVGHAGGMVGGSVILWFMQHLVSIAMGGVKQVRPLQADQVAQLEAFLVDRLSGSQTEKHAEDIATALLRAVGIHAEERR